MGDADEDQAGWYAVADSTLPLAPQLRRLGCPTSPKQLALLEELRTYYRDRGLLAGGGNPALFECCSERDACWQNLQDRVPLAERAGITLPWIGPTYDEHRVLVVGHNLRDRGGLLVEQKVAGQVIAMMCAGRWKPHRSWFAYRSLLAARAVIAALRGQEASPDPVEPAELVPTLRSSARIQLVKCSPTGGRSVPSAEMDGRCPRTYLEGELELLRPHAIISLGAPAGAALRAALPETVWSGVPRLSHGRTFVVGDPCWVFCMAHPAATERVWGTSYESLCNALGALRLGVVS